jgi:hypothetical protein
LLAAVPHTPAAGARPFRAGKGFFLAQPVGGKWPDAGFGALRKKEFRLVDLLVND